MIARMLLHRVDELQLYDPSEFHGTAWHMPYPKK